MIERRHQVFVSSTYSDLLEERSEVMQALLELECMPAGMELFPATNDSQWDWIKKVIDESDYYIVIVAGRYGSIAKDSGLSYTEMEYRYAVSRNKPVIGFLVEDPTALSVKNVDQQPGKQKKLDAFRDLVKTRLCKFYTSPADLGAKVSRSITQLKKQYPKPGWVRAEVLESFASSDELLQLRKENDELKQRVLAYGLEEPKSKESLASGSEEYEILFMFTREAINPETGRFRKIGEEWATAMAPWDEIFAALGPTLLQEVGRYWGPARLLSSLAQQCSAESLQRKYPSERFSNFRVTTECLNTILLQLRALKLIDLDVEKNWELTPYGDNYLVSLLGVPKGKTS